MVFATLSTGSGAISVPSVHSPPLSIPSGLWFHLPLNIPLGNQATPATTTTATTSDSPSMTWATAQLLARIEAANNVEYIVLLQVDEIEPEIALAGVQVRVSTANLAATVVVRIQTAAAVVVVVVSVVVSVVVVVVVVVVCTLCTVAFGHHKMHPIDDRQLVVDHVKYFGRVRVFVSVIVKPTVGKWLRCYTRASSREHCQGDHRGTSIVEGHSHLD